jgi:hypothetical protein
MAHTLLIARPDTRCRQPWLAPASWAHSVGAGVPRVCKLPPVDSRQERGGAYEALRDVSIRAGERQASRWAVRLAWGPGRATPCGNAADVSSGTPLSLLSLSTRPAS